MKRFLRPEMRTQASGARPDSQTTMSRRRAVGMALFWLGWLKASSR